MAKRSFSEFSIEDSNSIASILQHADELVQAATTLRDDLLRATKTSGEQKNGSASSQIALQSLATHKPKINAKVEALNSYADKGLRQQDADESSLPSKRPATKDQTRESSGEASSSSTVALPIPSLTSLTRWTHEDIPTGGMPTLPPVFDADLETAALTHSGMVTRTDKQNCLSYERLEWLGDAYLYLIATVLIFQTFPDLGPGRCAQLREKLVKNETLSEYSLNYDLDQRARFPAEFGLSGRAGGSRASDKNKKKVLGDIFEAYAAALILGSADGLSRMSRFMKTLWSQTISHEIRQKPAQSDTQDSLSAKMRLTKMLGYKGVRITYRDICEPKKDKDSKLPIFTVGVFLDGWGETNLQLGFGSALQKKEAGCKAAQQALDNKKLLAPLIKKRKDLVDAIERQNES